MRKFIILHTPNDKEITVNVNNITEFYLMTDFANVCLSSGKSEAVKESPEEILRLIDSLDNELPTGEFTGGEPIDDDDDPDAPEITTYDISTGEPIVRKLEPDEAAPGTRFKFGELTETENGMPLLELTYKTWKGEEKVQYLGPFRCYDFSIGPKRDIGCGRSSSSQMSFRDIGVTPEVGELILNAVAKDAICNWCSSHGLVPNPGVKLGWHDNVYKQFIKNCAVYIYGESHVL